MSSVNDILLARIMQDKENELSAGQAASIGAGVGALGGIVAGQPVHMLGSALGGLVGRKRGMFRPGGRMTGGLAGAIAGGLLGPGAAYLMQRKSPASEMLGKLQAGTFTEADKYVLARLLEDSYDNMGAA